ncbi:hypothetical protein HRbin08_02151 [bacterium HR08]|uniref:Hypothetical conserved protein n=1 Tax=uncultured Acidobacteriota bacterium TaxID=171953 RepID=H5SFE6_9BACT|nr:hypothetical conserved protein [uncultured Acidobacteriota bacterium]GBC78655.1 hypothetical protein HRbin08_02151 [bacterium HR08]
MRDAEERAKSKGTAPPAPLALLARCVLSGRSLVRGLRAGLRRLYDWTLRLAETPQAVLALFAIAFVESSFFPIPPDALLIAMVVATPRRFARYAAVCTLGSVLGGMFGYLIGYAFMETLGWRIIDFYNARALWGAFQAKYQAYGLIFLAIAAFTPIPYKVATIASGATQIDFLAFSFVSALGRGARFFLVAGLLRLFGEPIRAFIERYFDALSLLFVLLLIVGFLTLGVLR